MLNHFLFHLDKVEQEVYVLRQGVWLMSRQEPKHHIHLYALGSYYVELFYHCKSSVVTCLRVFQTVDFLEPYLPQIAIPEFG